MVDPVAQLALAASADTDAVQDFRERSFDGKKSNDSKQPEADKPADCTAADALSAQVWSLAAIASRSWRYPVSDKASPGH